MFGYVLNLILIQIKVKQSLSIISFTSPITFQPHIQKNLSHSTKKNLILIPTKHQKKKKRESD